MISGIIFDLDGILLDTEKIYFSCWKQSAKEFGFTMPDEVALAVRSCCQTYAEPYLKRTMGESFDYVTIRNRRRELVSQWIAEHGIQQKPGILPLLSYCEAHQITPAIATATSRTLAEERLFIAKLDHVFTHILGGDEVPCGKPAPDIYRIAAQQLGFPTSQCIAVEDSPNGIVSAFAAGCKVIMVPDLTPPDTAIQPLLLGVASNLEEIIPIIDPLMKKN